MTAVPSHSTFTKLEDHLVERLGLLPGVVLCAVLRYCRMQEGACRASIRSIGKRCNLNESTVHKYLRWLTAEGYLVDLTPTRRFAPHTYRPGPALHQPQPEPDEPEPQAEPAGEPQAPSGAEKPSTAAPAQRPASGGGSGDAVCAANTPVCQPNAAVCESNASVWDALLKRVLRNKQDTSEDMPAIPELQAFQKAAGFAPHPLLFREIIDNMRLVAARLERVPSRSDLEPYARAWLHKGYNPHNPGWLEWAARGFIPHSETFHDRQARPGARPAPAPHPAAALTPSQEAAYRAINARRQARARLQMPALP